MTQMQERNPEMVRTLGADFQLRYEPNFAWKSACSAHLALPGLRAFWPMSSFDENGDAFDLSGQGRTLDYNGSGLYNFQSLAPYIYLDGNDYLERNDELGIRISATETYVAAAARGISFGAWVRFDGAAAAQEQIIAKCDGAGAGNLAYELYRTAGGVLELAISDGAAIETQASAETLAATTWYHVAGKFDPSTEKAVLVNGNKTTAATALALLNVTDFANLQIGGRDDNAGGSTENMTGRVCFAFLCCTVLPDSTIQSLYHQTRAMFGV